jgi:hypothetical protein
MAEALYRAKGGTTADLSVTLLHVSPAVMADVSLPGGSG